MWLPPGFPLFQWIMCKDPYGRSKEARFFAYSWVIAMPLNIWNHTSFWQSSTCQEEQTEAKMYDFSVLYISWTATKFCGWVSFEISANCLSQVYSLKLNLIAENVPLFSGWKVSKRHVYILFIFRYACINVWLVYTVDLILWGWRWGGEIEKIGIEE